MSTVVGIDVGGSRKGFHAVALTDTAFKERIATSDVTDLAAWCRKMGATTVAVDAPCRWSVDGRARQAERRLMELRIWCFSTPTKATAVKHPTNQFGWMLAGERLYLQLNATYRRFDGNHERTSKHYIETFPHAVVCALRGRVISAKQKSRIRREVLKDCGVDPTTLPNIDFVDAALCALAANRFEKGEFVAHGSPEDGHIVVPLKPRIADQA